MGPILIVHGGESGRREALFARALERFHSLCGLAPAARICHASTLAASFPQHCCAALGAWTSEGKKRWACGAGTWFFQGKAGLRGLQALMESFERFPGCLAGIDGIFSLAIGDSEKDELLLVTDRLGSLHLYLAELDGCWIVCTSSLVIGAVSGPPWDLAGCRQFLATGTVFEKHSLFQGIEKLEPATVFRFQGGRLRSKEKYWDIASVMHDRARVEGDFAKLANALVETMGTIRRNFERPVLDLTGGYDSRAILAAMLRAGGEFDTVVNGPDGHPDVRAACQIAREFNLRHLHQAPRLHNVDQVWQAAKESLALTDGEYDVLLYHSVLDVHRRLAERFDVSVNGSNGEISRGYWWELLRPFTGWKGHFDARKIAAKRFTFDGEEPGLLAHEFDEDLTGHFAAIIERANAPLASHPNTAKLDNVYLSLRMQRWQGRISSATARLWPCVSPFAFRGPMEIALSTPPRGRERNRMSARVIEHLNPRLAALPLAEGYPALPLRWNTLPKFWPIAGEFARRAVGRVHTFAKGGLRAPAARHEPFEFWQLEEVRDLLDPARMASRDLYRPQAIRELLENSRKPGFPGAARFGRILTLEMLARAVRS